MVLAPPSKVRAIFFSLAEPMETSLFRGDLVGRILAGSGLGVGVGTGVIGAGAGVVGWGVDGGIGVGVSFCGVSWGMLF